MKRLKIKWLAVIAVMAAVAIFAAFSLGRNEPAQYFTSRVERGNIHEVVEATGTVNAVTTVQVGSQVSGTIARLHADYNSRVKKGQVIAEIDPSLLQGALLQAQADVRDAQANVAASRANLAKAKATAEQSAQDYQRNAGLAKDGIVSAQQLDAAKAATDSAQAAVSAAEAQLKQAQAQVGQKQAALTVAQTSLDHTIIRTPIDGIVTARNVDVGQTVAASLQAPTLFNIAQDLTKMQVDVSTDESDVGGIKVGQPVSFTVDAYPRETFPGKVVQIRLNATTVQNVVTYDTVVQFDNPDMKLFPGMTAYVTIPIADANDVLKVPDGALRFVPSLKPAEIQALYQKYGINPAAKSSGGAYGTAIAWKLLPGDQLEPVQFKTGITDHTFTAVAQTLHGSLNPGDQLAIGSLQANRASAPSAPGGPGGMSGRPMGR